MQSVQLTTDIIYVYTRSISIEAMPNRAEMIVLDQSASISTSIKAEKILQEHETKDFYSVSLLIQLTHTNKECVIDIHYVGIFSLDQDHPDEEKIYTIYNIAPRILLPYLNAFLHSALPLSGIVAVNISITNFDLATATTQALQNLKTSKQDSNSIHDDEKKTNTTNALQDPIKKRKAPIRKRVVPQSNTSTNNNNTSDKSDKNK